MKLGCKSSLVRIMLFFSFYFLNICQALSILKTEAVLKPRQIRNSSSLMECTKVMLPPSNARGAQPSIATWSKNTQAGMVRVPYILDPSLAPDAIKAISMARLLYRRYTCISLELAETFSDVDYVRFQDDNTGCYSYLGRTGGLQEINLSDPGCLDALGTTLHEIGHALGMHHEQSRPDRDKYVTVYSNNIKAGFASNFAKVNLINSLGTAYDFLSMMHYPSHAFALQNTYTLLKKDGSVIEGQRNGFSEIDVAQMNLLYNCGGVKEDFTPPTSCYRDDDKGLSYRGTLNTVMYQGSVLNCENWNTHEKTSLYYLQDLKDNNYCRNPNPMFYNNPICYVNIQGGIYYLDCDVPQCSNNPPPVTNPPPATNQTIGATYSVPSNQTQTKEPCKTNCNSTAERGVPINLLMMCVIFISCFIGFL